MLPSHLPMYQMATSSSTYLLQPEGSSDDESPAGGSYEVPVHRHGGRSLSVRPASQKYAGGNKPGVAGGWYDHSVVAVGSVAAGPASSVTAASNGSEDDRRGVKRQVSGAARKQSRKNREELQRRCRRRMCFWGACSCVGVFVSVIAVVIAMELGRVRMPTLPSPCTEDCVDFDHSLWTQALRQYTAWGSIGGFPLTVVQYTKLMEAPKSDTNFTKYLSQLAAAPLQRLNDTARKALFINAYNALTVKMIVDNPTAAGTPVESITKIGTLIVPVWKRKAGVVGGLTFSLDNIEQDYLRPHFQDPRIHASLNCASISCPDLYQQAFTTANVSAQLTSRVQEWMRQPKRGLDINRADSVVTLNKIFSWYSDDFQPSVQSFVARFASPSDAQYLRSHESSDTLEYFEYNWNLNGM